MEEKMEARIDGFLHSWFKNCFGLNTHKIRVLARQKGVPLQWRVDRPASVQGGFGGK